MIKALIFDCFGVLYRDNLSLLYDIVPLEKHQQMQDIIHATDHGMLSRDEYYQGIAAIAGKSIEAIAEIDHRQHSRDEAMIELVKRYKAEYKIGFLSNIDSDTIHRLFPEPERSELFDAFVVSGEVGLTKPSLELFELTATRLDVEPEECLMIDDIPNNIDGATTVGMKGICFSSRLQLVQELNTLLT